MEVPGIERVRALLAVAISLVVLGLAACTDGEAPALTPDSSESATGGRPGGTPREQPNVVLFVTDDQTLDELAVMPRTRRLIGDAGTTFRQAIAQYPLCCPSRATLLTGQVAHNHGVLGNEEPWGGYGHFDETETLPLWLQDAGYRTAMVGKYLNGYPDPADQDGATHVPDGWTDWYVPVVGPYQYRSFTVNENGTLVPRRQYQSTWTAETVSSLVREYAEGEAPFFVWSGFLAPHVGGPVEADDPTGEGRVGTPAVEDRYRDTVAGGLPPKPSRHEADLSDKPSWLEERSALDPAAMNELFRQRRESLRSVDDAIARVVDTLAAVGELDDTVLVFTSDNGTMLGEHGFNQKIYGYEESIRVPLLMAGPGIARGAVRDQLVSLTDLPATILDLARAKPGLPQDGVSLVDATNDHDHLADRHLLLEAGGWPNEDQQRLYTGIRTSDGRVLLRYFDGWVETYDLADDPFQLDGTTSEAERPWREELLAELDRLETCAGKECLAP
ncbi:arylsulfatase A-like enzyme [Nocardioides thalensis]|uniref:Arylsulfatase A-like enzyme n=1 Tax=Nocardioides thalensis TaxID=1914755 RepID=A0A853C0U8_9ACTN|nr:sulfatase [Nocardioides thalensis]NYJ01860.1 arylsulfatase A-like enzyme [Nocardioides thalensis]